MSADIWTVFIKFHYELVETSTLAASRLALILKPILYLKPGMGIGTKDMSNLAPYFLHVASGNDVSAVRGCCNVLC